MALHRDDLVGFLNSEGLDVQQEGIDDHTPLFSSNLMDSFKMVSLVMLVEKRCGIRVGPAELTLENFDTIGNILNFSQAQAK